MQPPDVVAMQLVHLAAQGSHTDQEIQTAGRAHLLVLLGCLGGVHVALLVDARLLVGCIGVALAAIGLQEHPSLMSRLQH